MDPCIKLMDYVVPIMTATRAETLGAGSSNSTCRRDGFMFRPIGSVCTSLECMALQLLP